MFEVKEHTPGDVKDVELCEKITPIAMKRGDHLELEPLPALPVENESHVSSYKPSCFQNS